MLPLAAFSASSDAPESDTATTTPSKLTPPPRVICEQVHQKRRIYYANHTAQQAGISIGMSLGSANSLCANLHSRLRSPACEQAQLEKLAKKVAALTPYVQIDAEHFSIYLEISTCLKLHKGLTGFQHQLDKQLGALAKHTQQALGPSAECAAIFARYYPGNTHFWALPKKFWQQWHALPINSLLVAPKTRQALTDCGFTQIADIVQLDQTNNNAQAYTQAPQLQTAHLAALKRRFGAHFAQYWHQLCGQQQTLRHTLPTPTEFDKTLALPCEAEQLQALLPAIQSLLSTLEHFLIQHCASILYFVIQFKDTRHRTSTVKVQLTQPHHRATFFFELAQLQLQQQLQQRKFPAPIIETRLYTTQCITQQNTPLDLFDTNNRAEATGTLLSRLQARLGQTAISHISEHEDYRPEHACNINSDIATESASRTKKSAKARSRKDAQQTSRSRKPAPTKQASTDGMQQPTWLIQPLAITNTNTTICAQKKEKRTQKIQPRVLQLRAPHITHQHASQQSQQSQLRQTQLKTQFGLNPNGSLTLLQGPHYVCAGWWDNNPAHRAYYIARSPKHSLYWIFQDLTTEQWFLQGFFS